MRMRGKCDVQICILYLVVDCLANAANDLFKNQKMSNIQLDWCIEMELTEAGRSCWPPSYEYVLPSVCH